MRKQNENIDLLLRKVFTIALFLFVFFVFKSNGCKAVNSNNHPVAIEQVAGINNSAVLVEPLYFSNFDNSLFSCDLPAFDNNGNIKVICLNNKTNHLLLFSKERFIEIKAQITDLNPHHIRASLTNEEDSQIS